MIKGVPRGHLLSSTKVNKENRNISWRYTGYSGRLRYSTRRIFLKFLTALDGQALHPIKIKTLRYRKILKPHYLISHLLLSLYISLILYGNFRRIQYVTPVIVFQRIIHLIRIKFAQRILSIAFQNMNRIQVA